MAELLQTAPKIKMSAYLQHGVKERDLTGHGVRSLGDMIGSCSVTQTALGQKFALKQTEFYCMKWFPDGTNPKLHLYVKVASCPRGRQTKALQVNPYLMGDQLTIHFTQRPA